MKRTVRTGPKRLRWRRRDWSGKHGLGRSRRWDSSDGKFKTEREARRAGLTGKLGKHPNQGADPMDDNRLRLLALLVRVEMHATGRARATGEREAVPDSLANQREE
jgi:hypothetical protein